MSEPIILKGHPGVFIKEAGGPLRRVPVAAEKMGANPAVWDCSCREDGTGCACTSKKAPAARSGPPPTPVEKATSQERPPTREEWAARIVELRKAGRARGDFWDNPGPVVPSRAAQAAEAKVAAARANTDEMPDPDPERTAYFKARLEEIKRGNR